MRSGNLFVWVLCALALVGGCGPARVSSLPPLERTQLQVRDYEHVQEIVFNSVVSALQDLDYAIRSADRHTGLITAASLAESGGGLFGTAKVRQTDVTAFVESIAGRTRVRLNLVSRKERSSATGRMARSEEALLEAEMYRKAFAQIENAILVRSGK